MLFAGRPLRVSSLESQHADFSLPHNLFRHKVFRHVVNHELKPLVLRVAVSLVELDQVGIAGENVLVRRPVVALLLQVASSAKNSGLSKAITIA